MELSARDDWAESSPLHWAAYAGSDASIHALIEHGCKVTVVNSIDGSIPLHLAARYGRAAAAAALLHHDAPTSATNKYGNTPLHECCYKGQAHTAEVLLKAGASAEVYNDYDGTGARMLTPLLVAAEVGSIEVIRVLLQANADPLAPVRSGGLSGSTCRVESKRNGKRRSLLSVGSVVGLLGRQRHAQTGTASSPRTATLAPVDENGVPDGSEKASRALKWRTIAKAEVESSRQDADGDRLSAPSTSEGRISHERLSVGDRCTGIRKLSMSTKSADARGVCAVGVALQAGHLAAVSELLAAEWRMKAPSASSIGFGEQVEFLEPRQYIPVLLNGWANQSKIAIRNSARLLALIILSSKHVALSDRLSRIAIPGKPLPAEVPRNPVLLALKLSVICRQEARRLELAGRRGRSAKVLILKATLEAVALGILEAAQHAGDEAAASKTNMCVFTPFQPVPLEPPPLSH